MIEFMKKRKYVLLALFLIFLFIFVAVSFNNNKNTNISKTPPTPTTSKIADFNGIVPGTTTIEDINKLLGRPIESTKSGDLNIYSYRSTNQYRHHKVISKDGLAELVVEEVIDKSKTAEDIRKIYGLAPEVLYEKALSSVFNLYVYPSNGIAYLGHADGTMLEIWYFTPTDIGSFISNWGGEFSRNPSNTVPKY